MIPIETIAPYVDAYTDEHGHRRARLLPDDDLDAFVLSVLVSKEGEKGPPAYGYLSNLASVVSLSLKARRRHLRDLLHIYSPLQTQRTCGKRMGPLRDDGTRLRERCRTSTCPRCARHDGFALAQDTLTRTTGAASMYLVTLTARTPPERSLEATWAAVTAIWRRSDLDRVLRRQGFSWLRCPEVTWSVSIGWHCHFHVVLVHDGKDRHRVDAWVRRLLARWIDAAAKEGYAASEYGQQADWVPNTDRYRVVNYATKGLGLYVPDDDDEHLGHQDAEEQELVRDLRGLSPAYLGLIAQLDDDDDARALYLEVVANPGTKSRGGKYLRAQPRPDANRVSAASAAARPAHPQRREQRSSSP